MSLKGKHPVCTSLAWLITSFSAASALPRPAFLPCTHSNPLAHRHTPNRCPPPSRVDRTPALWRSLRGSANAVPSPLATWQYEMPGIEGSPLAHYMDPYGSAVCLDAGGASPEDFKAKLGESLHLWRAAGCKAAWLRLKSPEDIDLVPVAVHQGFTPHLAATEPMIT